MRSTILGAMLTVILSSGTALAQSAPASPAPLPAPHPAAHTGHHASVSELPRADLGVTSGWNNPGGLYGIAELPDYLAREDLAFGALREVLPGALPVTRKVYALYLPSRYLPPQVRAFVELLVRR